MAKKNKDDPKDLAKVVEDLIKDVGDDRDMLVNFTTKLIETYDGDQMVGISEYVAKLADALTRQNQVKVAILKTIVKNQPTGDDESEMDDIHKEIGLPFEDEGLDEGSN